MDALNQDEQSLTEPQSAEAEHNAKSKFDVKLAMDMMRCHFTAFEQDTTNNGLVDWVILALSPMGKHIMSLHTKYHTNGRYSKQRKVAGAHAESRKKDGSGQAVSPCCFMLHCLQPHLRRHSHVQTARHVSRGHCDSKAKVTSWRSRRQIFVYRVGETAAKRQPRHVDSNMVSMK